MIAFIKGLLMGIGLGIVLYKVGAARYTRVVGMLTLRDTKVMKFAFTAISFVSFVYGFAAILGVDESLHLVPRVMPYMGVAHLIGGILFGAGMGYTGFCPGTCAAKVGGLNGDKKFTAVASVLGLFAGILVYAYTKKPLVGAGIISETQKPLTLYGILELPYGAVAIVWGALFALITLVVHRFTKEKHYELAEEPKSFLQIIRGDWHWLVSGILMGALIIGATMQDAYLGISGSLLATTGWIMNSIGLPLEAVPRINDDIFWRSAMFIGIFPGGFLAYMFSIKSKAAASFKVKRVLDVPAILKSFFGAISIAFGAMIGGGCTTGAFIAAWPTLSVGSLAMAGTFFAASMITANVVVFIQRVNFDQMQALGDRVYD